VRPSGDARRPLLTLSWQEGVTAAAPTALAAAPGTERRDDDPAHGRP
jgi:hypothetical protein